MQIFPKDNKWLYMHSQPTGDGYQRRSAVLQKISFPSRLESTPSRESSRVCAWSRVELSRSATRATQTRDSEWLGVAATLLTIGHILSIVDLIYNIELEPMPVMNFDF